jgi:hypothetical protein
MKKLLTAILIGVLVLSFLAMPTGSAQAAGPKILRSDQKIISDFTITLDPHWAGTLGVFIQKDVYGPEESQGTNRTAYFGNNLVQEVDPSSDSCQNIDASGHIVSVCVRGFIQKDVHGSGESQGTSRTIYFGNNPVQGVDPSSDLCQDIDASGHIVSICINGGPIRYGKPHFNTPNISGARPIGESYPGTLRYWEARGVHFSGEGWNNERIQTQLTAMERSAGAINSYKQTQHDWGLDMPGGLIFHGSYDSTDCPSNGSVTRPGCYLASTNTITLLWSFLSKPGYCDAYLEMTATAIHELGHAVDYHAGLSAYGDYSSKYDWAISIPGWVKVNGSWEYGRSPEGMVSNYARTNPQEDFAETWAWWVDTRNTFTLHEYNVWDGPPNQDRLDALALEIYHPYN